MSIRARVSLIQAIHNSLLPGTEGASKGSEWESRSKVTIMKDVAPDHMKCMMLTVLASLLVGPFRSQSKRRREKETEKTIYCTIHFIVCIFCFANAKKYRSCQLSSVE